MCACVLIVVFLCTYNRLSSLQRTATCIQRAITYYNIRQRAATSYNVLQRITTYHTRDFTRRYTRRTMDYNRALHEIARVLTTYYNVLCQRVTMYYNVLQCRTRAFHELHESVPRVVITRASLQRGYNEKLAITRL